MMNQREQQKLEAKKMVNKIRQGANLTKKESRLLSDKMQLPMTDLTTLPPVILAKLRESAIKQGITSYTSPLNGKELSL